MSKSSNRTWNQTLLEEHKKQRMVSNYQFAVHPGKEVSTYQENAA